MEIITTIKNPIKRKNTWKHNKNTNMMMNRDKKKNRRMKNMNPTTNKESQYGL